MIVSAVLGWAPTYSYFMRFTWVDLNLKFQLIRQTYCIERGPVDYYQPTMWVWWDLFALYPLLLIFLYQLKKTKTSSFQKSKYLAILYTLRKFMKVSNKSMELSWTSYRTPSQIAFLSMKIVKALTVKLQVFKVRLEPI